jgi:hypothetical protein
VQGSRRDDDLACIWLARTARSRVSPLVMKPGAHLRLGLIARSDIAIGLEGASVSAWMPVAEKPPATPMSPVFSMLMGL